MKRFARAIRSILYATVFLLVVGLVILYFSKDSGVALKDILFWVGVVPVALFSIGAFGGILGINKGSDNLNRPISDRGAKRDSRRYANEQKQRTNYPLTWMSAGLLVWLIAYFL